jgi:superfamily II DNA or RNA helicase
LVSDKLVLKVDHNSTYVQGKMGKDVYDKFKKKLGYLPENSFWMIQNNAEKAGDNEEWKKEWDGYISAVCWNKQFCHCHIKKKGLHFHTGLLSKAVDFFRENNIPFKRVDIRDKVVRGAESERYSMSGSFELREYQQKVVDEIVGTSTQIGRERGIIKAATGSGKTSLACSLISRLATFPTIFYVPSIDLLKQAKDEIEKFILKDGKPVEVGMVGGGNKDIKDITVMTIQTAVRALGGVWIKFDDEDTAKEDANIEEIKTDVKDLIQKSRLMIADECQHWSAQTCQIISDASILCQYKYAMSATPYRDQGDDILIEGCFGRDISSISASLLIKKGYLIKPTIYFNKIDNMRGTKKLRYANVYKQAIVENEFRNSQIVEMASRFLEGGRKILILVKQIAHGKLLEKLIPDSIFVYGGTAKKKRQKHLEQMRKGDPQITISSVIFDEGIDVKPLDTLILAGGGKSATRALQRIGRILRPYEGKKTAIAVDFMDNCKYMLAHSKKRLKMYKTEEEFEIIGD